MLGEDLELFMGSDSQVEGVFPQVSDLVWFLVEVLSCEPTGEMTSSLLSCCKPIHITVSLGKCL